MHPRQGVDETDPLMPIGMFSRASLLSVKTLRIYHEQGLLIPDSIDTNSGYRSYRVSQLVDAAIIKRLRDLDVGLKDVAEVVHARDPEITRKVITNHEVAMREKLDDVTRIVDQLQQSIDLPSLHTPAHTRAMPESHVLLTTGLVDEANYAAFLGDAFGRLFAAATATGAAMAGPTGARYPASVDTEQEPVEAFIPISAPVTLKPEILDTGVSLGLIPAATCAVITHTGSYRTIGETYRQLGAWVARNERTADQPVREYYVVSVDMATGQLLPDDQLRTEIAWPIHPNPTTNT